MKKNKSLTIDWSGPFGWPKFEGDLPSIPEQPGVYLMTVKCKGGYLIYGAGITRRSIPLRFREHTRKYLDGVYNVLDPSAMQRGVRKVVWQGFWMGEERSPRKQAEFDRRRVKITIAVCRQLAGCRIFVANIGTKPRILERLEAGIMNKLDNQPTPFRDIPDQGMMLAPRWESEIPIAVNNKCSVILHGLPRVLEI